MKNKKEVLQGINQKPPSAKERNAFALIRNYPIPTGLLKAISMRSILSDSIRIGLPDEYRNEYGTFSPLL